MLNHRKVSHAYNYQCVFQGVLYHDFVIRDALMLGELDGVVGVSTITYIILATFKCGAPARLVSVGQHEAGLQHA